MIGLELDLRYLSSHYLIGTNALKQYQGKGIVEIMEIEAAKGNPRAAEFMLKITSNPEELTKLLQLINPQNRYLILMNMNENDLMEVMSFLQPQELLLGLSIFTGDAIIELMKKLEPESLATVVLEKMDAEKFLAIIPEKFLDEFLDSSKINRGMFLEALHNVDEFQLQKMMESVTGQPCYDEKDSIINNLSSLSDDRLLGAMHQFEPKGKQQLIIGLLNNKPELFEEFSPEAMTYPFKAMDKSDVLKSLMVLETKDLLPMVEDLPREFMALVATQINPDIFSKLLVGNFSDILAKCGIDF